MKRLNIKFVAIFLVASLIVGVGVHFLHAFNVRSTADVMLKNAQSAEEEGDIGRAMRLYATYDKQRNKDHDTTGIVNAARIANELADAPNATRNDHTRAYQLLESAVRRAPDEIALRRSLAELLINSGAYSAAEEHVEKLIELGQDDPELSLMAARCQEEQGFYREAIALLSPLIGYNAASVSFGSDAGAPETLDAYLLLAKMVLEPPLSDPVLADKIVDRMVVMNPDSGEAFLKRGIYLRATNILGSPEQREARTARANDDIRTALEKSPDDADVLIENGSLATREKDYATATALMKQGVEKHPDDPRFYMQLAHVTFYSGRGTEAVAYAEQAIEKRPKNVMLLILLYELHLNTGQFDEARDVLRRMSELKLNMQVVTPMLEMCEARIQLREGEVQEAAQTLERTRLLLDNNPMWRQTIDLELARAYEILQQYDRQLDTWDRLLGYEADMEEARLGRAQTLQRLGRLDDAIEAMQRLEFEMGAAEFYASSQRSRFYLSLLEAKLKRDPNNKRLQGMVAKLSDTVAERTDETAIQQELEAINETLKRKDVAAAIEQLRALAEKNPKEGLVWANLIQLTAAKNGPQAGLDALIQARSHLGASIGLRMIEARLLAALAPDDLDEQLERLAEGVDRFRKADQAKFWLSMAGIHAGRKPRDLDAARHAAEQAREASPGGAQSYLLLFSLARESDDAEGRQAIIDAIGEQFGDSSYLSLYTRAQSKLDRVRAGEATAEELHAAHDLVEEAKTERKSWHPLLTLSAEIAEMLGNRDAAITNYLAALQSGPPQANVIRRVAALLMQANRYPEASEVLAMLGEGATNPGLQRLRIQSDLGAGRSEEAVESLAKLIPEDSNDAGDLLWKGQVLQKLERTEEAEAAFRRAVELAPSEPSAWMALIQHLVLAGNVAAAEQVVRDAELRLPEDSSTFLLAHSHKLLGNHDVAERHYLEALQSAPNNLALKRDMAAFYLESGQGDKAANMLNGMIQSTEIGRNDLPNLLWARRTMAELLAAGGDYGSFLQAVKLVEGNAIDGQLSNDDLRLLALLHGRRSEPSSARQAFALLKQIEEDRPLAANEKLLLAQLHNRMGEWPEAQDLMRQLVAGDAEPQPAVFASYARMLLEHQEPREAAKWINKLNETNPESQQAVLMKAEAYLQLDATDYAVKTVTDWIELAKEDAQQAARMRAAIQLLEQREAIVPARALVEKLVALQSEADLERAAFQARHGSIDEAFAKFESEFDARRAVPICRVANAVLRSRPGDLTAAHRAQIADWFARAQELLSGSIAVQFEWASYNDVLGNADETIAAYRALLNRSELPPTQRGMVANNLAFKLALQKESLDEALALINSAIDDMGPAAALLDTRGMVFMQQGKTSEALRDFKDATSLGGSGDLHFHLALAYQQAGNPSGAQEAMAKAREAEFDPAELDPISRAKHESLVAWLKK